MRARGMEPPAGYDPVSRAVFCEPCNQMVRWVFVSASLCAGCTHSVLLWSWLCFLTVCGVVRRDFACPRTWTHARRSKSNRSKHDVTEVHLAAVRAMARRGRSAHTACEWTQ